VSRGFGIVAALLLAGGGLACGATPPRAAPHVAAGRVEEVRFPVELFGRTRRVWVYTPPADSARRDSLGLLVVFDGPQFLEEIPLPRMLDSLIAAKRIEPLVAVFIDNGTAAARREDLANRAAFADWLAADLLPWIRQRYPVSSDPGRAILAGSSAGGLGAAYAAFRWPQHFGNVLSLSGAFWRGNENASGAPFEWLTGQVAAAPRKNVRFYLEVGSTETHGTIGGAGPSILAANRRLRDALRAKRYDVLYREVPGGVHDATSWAGQLPAGLAALAAPRNHGASAP
jgi:enterochelin esterase family protein